MRITHNPEQNCFEAFEDNGEKVGVIAYARDGGMLIANHTHVEEAYRGRGIAGTLLDAMARYAEENNLKIRPLCSYVIAAFERDPHRYQAVIAD